MILSDTILGRENPWSMLYNPSRIKSYLSGEMLAYDVSSVTTLVKGKITKAQESLAGLGNDDARVVSVDGEKVAVYKDGQGELHAISASCTHMGCIVNWNNAEKTWDCPCHGSRYDIEGRVIQAPAVRNLKPYEIS
jgi:Rieske Fe-S protein